ncbi:MULTISPECIES: EamA family transporter [Micromonospora]|uniref:EamA family transporter n=1 Tax=Micromonospora TaxID=1873 RepID=UPI0003EEC6EF|nr:MULTISPECIES: EamA family transporter [unclassified Micromonospora]EWM68069.1 integral membrane protein [Micromonospora sp. M42]MCK1808967.1 EamA family transporter [Micromonospora sp. R42106]MCK1833540.1 EamA family transporter [Micromonospora sp. R42003]MCK1845498.1 EamA family transporter [Micromonospora sp. R42004]MCM1015932.1 EamA family transporter [Micromonospora sp. XM-20-01]
MLPIVLAAVSALAFGTADFSGGKASRWADPIAVTVVSQMLSLPLLVVLVLVVPGTPSALDLGWGLLAGVAGAGGVMLLYRALATGVMAVVAPVTAITAAIVPIVAGLVLAHSPGAVALGGAGLAVVAIALVSLGERGAARRVSGRVLAMALAAGLLFGVFFALLGQADESAGMWPVLAVRVSSVAFGLALAARTGTRLRLGRRVLGWAAAAGLLDSAANALFLAAAGRGHLSVVAAVASLYPASTVLLALAVDRERLRPVQLAGLGFAAAALVLSSV